MALRRHPCFFTLIRSSRLCVSCSIRCGFTLNIVGPAEPRAGKADPPPVLWTPRITRTWSRGRITG